MRHVLFALLLAHCSFLAKGAATLPADATQLILVTTTDWQQSQGQLQTFIRQDGQWLPGPLSTPVSLGRSGLAWGLGLYPSQPQAPQKVEGDGKTPAGIFSLGTAFGYASRLDSALPYLASTAGDYCMDVPDSPYYNQLVNADRLGKAAVAGSTEPLRLDLKTPGDMRYQRAIVVHHNPANSPNAGSCIFLHQWRAQGVTTSGCTAMAPDAMAALARWLDPAKAPLLVVMPNPEYRRLASSLALPRLP